MEYLNNNQNSEFYLFGEDKYKDNSKTFIVATKKQIYEKSVEKKYSLYEYYLPNQKVRLIFDIDLDFTKNELPRNLDKNNYFDDIINRVIEKSNIKISKYTNIVPQIIVLSANTDTKKSSHIIYKNIVFNDIYTMKYFVNELKSDLLNCYVDYSIYADRCMRLLWNCKYGKNNFLIKNKLINYNESNEENLFYDSMIVPQSNDYILIDYHILNIETNNVKQEIPKNIYDKKIFINDNNLKLDVPKEFIICLLDLLSYKRLHDYETWMEVVKVCRNYGLYDELINISKKITTKFDNKTIEIIDKIFSNPIPLHHLTKESIYKWCIKDNKNKFDEISKKYNIETNLFDFYDTHEPDTLLNKEINDVVDEITDKIETSMHPNDNNIETDTVIKPKKTKCEIDNEIILEIEKFINDLKENNKNSKRKLIKPDEIKKYTDLLSEKRCVNHHDYVNVGIMIKNSNVYAFDIWYDIFIKNNKENQKIDLLYFFKIWNKFKLYDVDISFERLKVCAKRDSPELYHKINPKEAIDERLFTSVPFEKDFLLDRNEKLLEEKSDISKYINEWYFKKIYKTLCIFAKYGCGKTSLVRNILEEFKPEKILILSYRQTLTYELKGNFSDFGVTSYLDKIYNIDRIICQIDSMIKVLSDSDPFATEFEIKTYDLVVIDESESVINHLYSNLINNKRDLFDFIRNILIVASKILVLDGDFGNRSYEFIRELGNNLILENISRKTDKKFIFMDDKEDFEEKIDKDLLNGKNIVVVSMSATEITKYMEKYEKKYKCILHTSHTSDTVKKELEFVNVLWKKYQLIMYSPNIEAGLSFVEEHLDNMYVILCKNTITQRALLQMMWRCRNVKNNKVFVYTNGLPFSEKCYPYTYNQTKLYTHGIYNDARKLVTEQKFVGDKQLTFARYEDDLFTKMNIYHEMDELNKHPFYFIPILLQLLKNKGCTYEYIPKKNKTDVKKKDNKSDPFKYKKILEVDDIDINEYNTLYQKRKNNEAESEDKYKLTKYYYKKCWKVDKIDEEFMKKFYMKTNTLFNLRYLTKELRNNILIEDITEDNFDEKILEELDMINDNNECEEDSTENIENINENIDLKNDNVDEKEIFEQLDMINESDKCEGGYKENSNENIEIIDQNKKLNDDHRKIGEKEIFEKNNNHIVLTKTEYNINYEQSKKNEMKKIVNDLLNILGYENVFSVKKIIKQDFLKNIESVMKNSLLIKNKKRNYPLFKLNKNCDYKLYEKKDNTYSLKTINNKLVRSFLCFINRVFNNYGFCVKYKESIITKKKIRNSVSLYKIKFNDNINNYL